MFGKFESCGPDCTNPHPINTSGSLNMFKGPRPPFIRIRIFVRGFLTQLSGCVVQGHHMTPKFP
jgi:hypothetical protein